MSQDILLWLFGGCFAGICASFAFGWANRTSAAREIDKAADRAERLRDELASYKQHVSDGFATIAFVAQVERRTGDALTEIKNIQKIQDQKLDRLIERR